MHSKAYSESVDASAANTEEDFSKFDFLQDLLLRKESQGRSRLYPHHLVSSRMKPGPMDPFSVISGVAGVATAAASLASYLHNLLSDIRDAPRDMRDMAGVVRELSDVLRELRGALRRGEGLLRPKMYGSIDVTTARIKELQRDIRALVESSGVVSRVLWTLRSKARAERLVGRIDSLILGLLLKLKTMSLVIVIEQTKRYVW